MGSVFNSLLLYCYRGNNKLFSWHIAHVSLWALNLPQDPLNSNVEEDVIERDEEEVIEEYDSDFDSNLSLCQLSEDEEMKSDVVVSLPWQMNKSSGYSGYICKTPCKKIIFRLFRYSVQQNCKLESQK